MCPVSREGIRPTDNTRCAASLGSRPINRFPTEVGHPSARVINFCRRSSRRTIADATTPFAGNRKSPRLLQSGATVGAIPGRDGVLSALVLLGRCPRAAVRALDGACELDA
jgi:hypothetical protein